MQPSKKQLAALIAAALWQTANATEVVGTAGDGRYLCAFDNLTATPNSPPPSVAFIDIASSADFAIL